MNRKEFEAQWREAVEPVLAEMQEWQAAHPRATFAEIEAAVEARLAPLRAKMVADLAQAGEAETWENEASRPRCPECGEALVRRGRHTRRIVTAGDQVVPLDRTYGECPRCQRGFFPLG